MKKKVRRKKAKKTSVAKLIIINEEQGKLMVYEKDLEKPIKASIAIFDV